MEHRVERLAVGASTEKQRHARQSCSRSGGSVTFAETRCSLEVPHIHVLRSDIAKQRVYVRDQRFEIKCKHSEERRERIMEALVVDVGEQDKFLDKNATPHEC